MFLNLVNHQITSVCLHDLNLQYNIIWPIIIEGIWPTPFLYDCLSKKILYFIIIIQDCCCLWKECILISCPSLHTRYMDITYYRYTEVNLLFNVTLLYNENKFNMSKTWFERDLISVTFYFYFLIFFSHTKLMLSYWIKTKHLHVLFIRLFYV